MAALVLCGLDSKPKLNGREVSLLCYHASRGRWEVELFGDRPMTDLFRIEWNDDWLEPMSDDKYGDLYKDKKKNPTFKELVDRNVGDLKVSEITATLTVLDIKDRKVCVFDEDGSLLSNLIGPHIARKGEFINVSRDSFPLKFLKDPEGEKKSLAVRPCCLRLKEDETLEKLRLRKVEISVNMNHVKPHLDGHFAQLGPFQAHCHCWDVRPDAKGLWDVKVDGSPCPVPLRSANILDETSGVQLQDPVRISEWDLVPGQRAVYATVAFTEGQVIFEEEPALYLNSADDCSQLFHLWQQLQRAETDKQASILDTCKGQECLRRIWKQGALSQSDFAAGCEDFRELSSRQREQCWNMLRVFDGNCTAHSCAKAQLFYLTISRINHSCHPNCLLVDRRSDEACKKVLIAQRDIEKGEELTYSYLGDDDLLEPHARRQKRFAARRGSDFECACRRCTEDSDGLLRTFRCTGGSPCAGTHAVRRHGTGGEGLAPCNVCGFECENSSHVLEEEELHALAFEDLMSRLSPESQLSSPDPLVQIIEGAAHSGLTEKHWVVCKARDVLSCFYQKHNQPNLAAENIKPILELQERVLGSRDKLRVEALAGHFAELGLFAESFRAYATALQATKLRSPEHPPGAHPLCDVIRKRLRGVVDAKPVGKNL